MGQRLPAPLVLQGSQYLENCHGDRAGIVNGFLTVSDGASAGRNFFRLSSQGTFAALVVDVDGNIFLQRANNQIFVLERGDGPRFTYTLELDDLGQLSLLNNNNDLYFGTIGRDVPRACPVLGCDSVDTGDCDGCLSSPNGQSCVYCPNEGTCLASTRACTGAQGLFFQAQCLAPTTSVPPSRVQPSLTPVPKGTAFTVRPPLTTTKPVTARPTVASGVTNGFVTRPADTNRPQFTVRPVTLPTLANQLFTSGPGDTDGDSSGGAGAGTLETGAIVGIALGAFLIVCAVLLLMGFLIVRHIRATKRLTGQLSVSSAAYHQNGTPWAFTTVPASTGISAATPTQHIPTVAPVMSTRQIEPEPTAATQATFYGPASETMQFYGSAQNQTQTPSSRATASSSTVRGTTVRGTGTYGLTPTPKPDF